MDYRGRCVEGRRSIDTSLRQGGHHELERVPRRDKSHLTHMIQRDEFLASRMGRNWSIFSQVFGGRFKEALPRRGTFKWFDRVNDSDDEA
jgi:hypothetical protein